MEDPKLIAAIVGGLIGGSLGVLSTALAAYWGPRLLEEWRERKKAEEWDEPRMRLLKQMLDHKKFVTRSIETLSTISGTPKDECRRLLINLGARGVRIKDKGRGTEGWALISRKPLTEEPGEEEN